MNIKFSIIIPVYNVAPYLRECLGSIAAAIEQCRSKSVECRTEVEVICVDDCSTDGSYELLKELSATLHFTLKLLHFPVNRGVSAARNRGLGEATGEWIGFVDGDDIIRPETFLLATQAIEENPKADAVHFQFQTFQDGEQIKWEGEGGFQTHIDNGVMPRIFLNGGFSTKFYSRNLIGDIRFKNYVRGEDCLFRAEVMAKAYQVVEIKASCYGYRQREGSAIHSEITARKLADELWLLELWRLWTTGIRRYDASRWRRLAQDLTEFYAGLFFGAPREIRHEVWTKWKSALLEIKGESKFPKFNRFVLAIFARFPFAWIAWCLFAFPYKLKKMGFHR